MEHSLLPCAPVSACIRAKHTGKPFYGSCRGTTVGEDRIFEFYWSVPQLLLGQIERPARSSCLRSLFVLPSVALISSCVRHTVLLKCVPVRTLDLPSVLLYFSSLKGRRFQVLIDGQFALSAEEFAPADLAGVRRRRRFAVGTALFGAGAGGVARIRTT